MPITLEQLKQEQQFSSMQDDVLQLVVDKVNAVENAAITTTKTSLRSELIEAVKSSGETPNSGENAVAFAKRVVTSLKESNTTLTNDKAAMETKNKDLEQKLLQNGDSALQAKVTELTTTNTTLTSKLQELQAEKTKLSEDNAKEIKKLKLDFEMKSALSGIEFDEKLDKGVINILTTGVINELNSKYVFDVTDNGVVVKDTNGQVVLDDKNGYKPITIDALLRNSSLSSVIKAKGGGGTGPVKPQTGDLLSLSGAKTQVEADNIITSHVSKLYAFGSKEYFDEVTKLRQQYNIDKLPIR